MRVNEDDELKEEVNLKLAQSTPREREILKKRFGLDTSADLTLEQIAKQFEITRKAIRAIEDNDDDDDPAAPA